MARPLSTPLAKRGSVRRARLPSRLTTGERLSGVPSLLRSPARIPSIARAEARPLAPANPRTIETTAREVETGGAGGRRVTAYNYEGFPSWLTGQGRQLSRTFRTHSPFHDDEGNFQHALPDYTSVLHGIQPEHWANHIAFLTGTADRNNLDEYQRGLDPALYGSRRPEEIIGAAERGGRHAGGEFFTSGKHYVPNADDFVRPTSYAGGEGRAGPFATAKAALADDRTANLAAIEDWAGAQGHAAKQYYEQASLDTPYRDDYRAFSNEIQPDLDEAALRQYATEAVGYNPATGRFADAATQRGHDMLLDTIQRNSGVGGLDRRAQRDAVAAYQQDRLGAIEAGRRDELRYELDERGQWADAQHKNRQDALSWARDATARLLRDEAAGREEAEKLLATGTDAALDTEVALRELDDAKLQTLRDRRQQELDAAYARRKAKENSLTSLLLQVGGAAAGLAGGPLGALGAAGLGGLAGHLDRRAGRAPGGGAYIGSILNALGPWLRGLGGQRKLRLGAPLPTGVPASRDVPGWGTPGTWA